VFTLIEFKRIIMTLVSIVLVYLMLWMVVFFISLPFGINIPDHPDEGNASSAPIKTNLKIKVFLSTLITLPLTYFVVSMVENDFINILIDRFDI
jgi:predicted secreted protein